MMGEGFMMDLGTLMVFYRYCRRFKVSDDDRAGKIAIMRRLTAKKKAKYIRDPQEFIKGKNALIIRRKTDE